MPGCQIDYLIQTRLGMLFVCEIKFSKNLIGTSVIEEVKEKINRLAVPKNFVCIPVLIQMNGVSEEVIDADYFFAIIHATEFLQEN
ncbi:MAG: hypothetical protein KIT27_02940 [Legionellales bacterium]|nr:hypothetical protein [Legionellales bacterium]